MKRLFLLTLLLGTRTVLAQHSPQVRVGWNVNPLLFRTVELMGEYRPQPRTGFTIHGGHTDRTRNEGIPYFPVGDYIDDRVTSGSFLKLGTRTYLSRWQQPDKPGSWFLGASVGGSWFRQSFKQFDATCSATPLPFDNREIGGFVGGVAGIAGWNLTPRRHRFGMDIGLQYSIQQRRETPGRSGRNYQPGFGRILSGRIPTSLQGIFTFSYRL